MVGWNDNQLAYRGATDMVASRYKCQFFNQNGKANFRQPPNVNLEIRAFLEGLALGLFLVWCLNFSWNYFQIIFQKFQKVHEFPGNYFPILSDIFSGKSRFLGFPQMFTKVSQYCGECLWILGICNSQGFLQICTTSLKSQNQ